MAPKFLMQLVLLLTTTVCYGSTTATLLASLGYKRAPRPSSTTGQLPTKHLLKLFNDLENDQDVVRIGRRHVGQITSAVSHHLTGVRLQADHGVVTMHTASFNTSMEAFNPLEPLIAAELRVHKHSFGGSQMSIGNHGNDDQTVHLSQTDRHGWYSADVTDWISNRTASMNLKLTVKGRGQQRVRREIRQQENHPIQLVSYHRSRRSINRRRRYRKRSYETLPHAPPDLKVVCRRRSLNIRFRDVGWDSWIVAPEGYDAGICVGMCPFPLSDVYNATNHAIIQLLMYSTPIRDQKSMPPSCVPVQLKSKPILYLGNNNEVILKVYDDMEVEYCGCR